MGVYTPLPRIPYKSTRKRYILFPNVLRFSAMKKTKKTKTDNRSSKTAFKKNAADYFAFSKSLLVFAGYGLLCGILVINIAFSQTVSPIYFSLLDGNVAGIAQFLHLIRPLPVYADELQKNFSQYGPALYQSFFQNESEQNALLEKLNNVLQKNPNSRDVLYSLYKLYSFRGDHALAQKYLQQAKEIDPTVQ